MGPMDYPDSEVDTDDEMVLEANGKLRVCLVQRIVCASVAEAGRTISRSRLSKLTARNSSFALEKLKTWTVCVGRLRRIRRNIPLCSCSTIDWNNTGHTGRVHANTSPALEGINMPPLLVRAQYPLLLCLMLTSSHSGVCQSRHRTR